MSESTTSPLGSEGYEPYKELLIANYNMAERGRQHEQISLLDYVQ